MDDTTVTFESLSRWLDDVLRRRCELLAKRSGKPLAIISIEMGRATLMAGVNYLGNGLKLPADTAIPIGESALAEFQRVHDMRN